MPRLAAADGIGVIAAQGADRAAVAEAMARAIGETSAAGGRAPRVVADAIAEARVALAAGAVPAESLVRFRRVREQAEEGWRAYLRVAVENAQLRLAAARTEAEPLLAWPGGAEVYADVALRLGAVLGHLGRKSEAQAVLALALALDPERPISLAEFSPDVVEAVEAARRAPAAMRRLRVETEPSGAAIRVDGAEVGRSPVEVEVARGQHVVIARAPLHHTAVRGVAIDDGPGQLALALEPDDDASRLAGGAERGLSEPAAQQLVEAAVRYADLDEVVVVADSARHGGPALLVQRCAGEPVRCTAVVELGYGDRAGLASAARAAWDAARGGSLRYPPVVLGDHGAGRVVEGGCKLCRNRWLWTGVGAALVTGAVIAIVATSGSRPPPIVGVDSNDWVAR